MIERFCNAWAWACFGFMLGFAACAMLNEAGYTKQAMGIIFWLLAGATAFISMLPRTLLEIVRRVRRLPRLRRLVA
jgi:hypothetical protein